tara:strand:- start:262 stop:408 length:147 start_codon:yes stop_codon:yes gene_type:complete
LPEKAADKKIRKLLEYAAAMMMMWIPKEKRNQYFSYLYTLCEFKEKDA